MQEEEVAEEEVRESALRVKERVGELLSVKPLEPPPEAVSVVRLARGLALSPGFRIGRGAAALLLPHRSGRGFRAAARLAARRGEAPGRSEQAPGQRGGRT